MQFCSLDIQLADMCDDLESTKMTRERWRSHSFRYLRCWHCGHTGHIRRRCFRRMRQQQRCMHYACEVLTQTREVVEYANDGDVTFTSSVPLVYMSGTGGDTSLHWLLDDCVEFHITSHREWFSTFCNARLGRVHFADGSTYDIDGAGDVCLSLPSGALYTLCHVHYVPQLRQSLISVRQLADNGWQVLLREQSF